MRSRTGIAAHWKPILLYGLALTAAALALAWIDYQRMVRQHWGDIYLGLVALAFLGLGIWLGMSVLAPRPAPFDGNPKVIESLGISARELRVLQELAAGRSNKEIADALHVSPNTIKTHIARLYEKLDATRRTDAVARARELGILP